MTNVKLPEEFYITKDNYDALIPKFSKHVESMINQSWYFQRYLKYIGAKRLIVFPIPLSVIIRTTTMEKINMNKSASEFDVSSSIINKLLSGKISYLAFNDIKTHTRVLEAIKHSTSDISGIDNHMDFYKYKVFPLVEEHFSMQQVEMGELKKLINGIYGMESGESEYCDECKAYMTFWAKYREYKI